jgi:hypothetical protein
MLQVQMLSRLESMYAEPRSSHSFGLRAACIACLFRQTGTQSVRFFIEAHAAQVQLLTVLGTRAVHKGMPTHILWRDVHNALESQDGRDQLQHFP